VRSASFSLLGLFGGGEVDEDIAIEGYASTSGREMNVNFDLVSPNYFSSIGIPVLLGREIGAQDGGTGQLSGVINQTMARYYFGDSNPIGQHIQTRNTDKPVDVVVVGVVGDAKYHNVRERTPRRCYRPFDSPTGDIMTLNFEIRSRGEPSALVSAIRTAVQQAAPNLPPIGMQTMNRIVDDTLGRDRLLTRLSGFFGILAAILASIGIYGIMSYAVARRTREIGIRAALGAQYGSILWLILGESLFLVLIGVAIGVPASLAAEKLMGSLLFGLPSEDSGVLLAAIALMFVVAALAGYIPARRAARVDPLVALRTE
jgi:predicted permease